MVAQKILTSLACGIDVENHHLQVTTSIGIAPYDGIQITVDALIRRAGQAMYQAKRSGRNTFRFTRTVESSVTNSTAPLPIAKFMDRDATSTLDIDVFLQEALQSIRTHLAMDVAFIAQFGDGERTFRYVDAKDPNPPISVGLSLPLEDGFCQRVVDGRLPELIPDAFLNELAMTLPATVALPVRAHLSVPIRLKNGQLCSTYCCVSYTADQSLNERDLSMLRIFADLAARHLERSST